MEIIKTVDSTEGAAQLQKRLISELSAGKRVLWLLSGGSNISIIVTIMDGISDDLTQGLSLALTDERFGPEGHPDSNWRQLYEAGFDIKSAHHKEVLTSNLGDLDYTAQQYGQLLSDLFAESDIIIGHFGIGPDGHTAGILPETEAVSATGWAVGYKTSTFERITMTFDALRQVHIGYAFAFGDGKKEALENLTRDVSLSEQPAQILKQLPECYVYNDQIGGTS